MTSPAFHEKELWSFVWFRNPRWECHRVLSVTDKRVWLEAAASTRQKRMGIDRCALERDGHARCSALHAQVYTSAAMKVEEVQQLIRQEELRRVVMNLKGEMPPWPGAGGFHSVDPGRWTPPSRTVGIVWPSSASAVRKTFRQLAKTKHPDAGGSAQEFIALQKSYEHALRMAVTP